MKGIDWYDSNVYEGEYSCVTLKGGVCFQNLLR